ncbi:MAG: twin-arginine translocase subunit TatC, partial [Fidelibacterota bacterium]
MRSIGKNKMAEPKIEKKEMPFLDHLEELRWRILKCIISIMIFTIVAFIFSDELIRFLIMPSQKLNPPINLQVLKVQGMLYVKIGVALSGGIIVSLPVILYQIWKFVVPGLLEKERRYILPLLFFSTIFFIIGAAFAYYIIIPVTLRFLIGLGIEEVKDNISINYYVSFVL